ncbi:hypothetical protein RSOLAG1IB_09238 [Rhizoctonia solani AG-1 IB]|uniref:Uncharacterized protein n=1 Tax=Thanatephorus cucumeris (strain AG1-IB / isolate 7/3/14) TaxID=1108050 RepID=A0A0B7FPT0_THACB|nr:hypothetical protein RSOLAG1IB_09238 [Rhizoctonia solani AG-1 IB]
MSTECVSCELELNNDIMGMGVRAALYAQIVLAWVMSLYWPDTFVKNSRAAYMTATAVLVSSLIEWKKNEELSLLDGIVVTLMSGMMVIFVVVSGTTREEPKPNPSHPSQSQADSNNSSPDPTGAPTNNISNSPTAQSTTAQNVSSPNTTPQPAQTAPPASHQSTAEQQAAAKASDCPKPCPPRSYTQWFIRFCFVNLWGGFCFSLWDDPVHFGLEGAKANCTTNGEVILWVFGAEVQATNPGIRIAALVLVSILYFFALCSLFFTLEDILDPVYNFLSSVSWSLKKDNTTQRGTGPIPLHQNPVINKIHYFLHLFAFGTLAYLIVSTELTIRRNDKQNTMMEWSYGQVIALILLFQQFNDLCSTHVESREKREEMLERRR